MTTVNRRITLAARPVGLPSVSDFRLIFSPLPTGGPGEVLVRSVFLSLDPYMRGRMDEGEPSALPIAVGGLMIGAAVGRVMASADPSFEIGDVVEGMLGWQDYAVAAGRELRRIDPRVAPISTALGVLGTPGLAAYFGLLDVGRPRRGETVLISSAAGAVGAVVAQIAKLEGCHAVGVAGSDAKLAWLLDDLGLDAAFNYKREVDFDRQLEQLCPEGIDVYFDNVGGAITDAAIRRLNVGARICVCGQISQCNLEAPERGPRWMGQLIVKEARAQGFLVSSYAERFAEGRQQLTRWLGQGRLKYREEVALGIEAAPQAFIGMLQGRNLGKQLVQLSPSSWPAGRPRGAVPEAGDR